MVSEVVDHGLVVVDVTAPQNGVFGTMTVTMVGNGGTVGTFHGQTFDEAAQEFWESPMGVFWFLIYLFSAFF